MAFNKKEFEIDIHTDGACRGNGKDVNIGGYGIVLKHGENVKEMRRAFHNTTNNKMELGSVIVALSTLECPCKVNLYSDSKYVVDAINQKWIQSWQKNARDGIWRKSNKESVANQDLWESLVELLKIHEVSFNWVKGHSSNKYNNRCDELANIAMNNKEFDEEFAPVKE